MPKKQLPPNEYESSPERESASVRHLDKSFSGIYRKWRHDNKGGYGFFYNNIKDEYTYQNGKGFIRDVPEYAEKYAMYNVNKVISCAMLIYILLNTLSVYVIPSLLSKAFGLNIGVDFTKNTYFGDEITITVYRYIVTILKRAIPTIMLGKISKMPLNIMIPLKTSNKALFGTAIPAALFVTAAGSIMMLPLRNIFSFVHAGINLTIINVSDTSSAVMLSVLSVLVTPILSEIFVHGACLQLLRQFGDGYALIITSLITAIASDDIRLFLYFFMFSLAIGYFTLRTGSVITAAVMRITISASFHVQAFISTIEDERISTILLAAFILICLILGIIFLIRFMITNNHKISLPLRETYLSPYDKMMTFFTTPSVIIWLTVAFAAMICTVPLDL